MTEQKSPWPPQSAPAVPTSASPAGLVELDDSAVLDRESEPDGPHHGRRAPHGEPVELDADVEDYVSSPFASRPDGSSPSSRSGGGIGQEAEQTGGDADGSSSFRSPMRPRRAVAIGQDSVPPPAVGAPGPAAPAGARRFDTPLPSRGSGTSGEGTAVRSPLGGPGLPTGKPTEPHLPAMGAVSSSPAGTDEGAQTAGRPGTYSYTNLSIEEMGRRVDRELERALGAPEVGAPEMGALESGAASSQEPTGFDVDVELSHADDIPVTLEEPPSSEVPLSAELQDVTPVPPESEPIQPAPPLPFSVPPRDSIPARPWSSQPPGNLPASDRAAPSFPSIPPAAPTPAPRAGMTPQPPPVETPPAAAMTRTTPLPTDWSSAGAQAVEPARSSSPPPPPERTRRSSVPPAAALAAAVHPHHDSDEFQSPDLSFGEEPGGDNADDLVDEAEMRLSEADLEISLSGEPPEVEPTPLLPADAIPMANPPPESASGPAGVQESRKPPPPKRSAKPSLPATKIQRRPWWETLFGDDFARAHRSPTQSQLRQEVDFMLKGLEIGSGQIVLDLGCGQGEHAVEMSRRGLSVVGYDLSVFQLAMAGDRAQAENQKINFLQGDMREMAFDAMFDGVLCWDTTFGYFEEEKNQDVARRVHAALKPGGSLLLMVLNRDFAAREAPTNIWFEGDGCVCMDDVDFDWITSRLRVKRSLILDDGRSKELHYSMRLYNLSEIGKLLHGVGFRVVQVSGDVSTPGAFFGPASPYIIIRAQRP